MARSYGRFTTDIWRDPKFRALEIDQQWAYFMLGTQPDISAAGMLPLTLKRWSAYGIDATPERLSDALSKLSERRFVVTDEDTEELLVRAFVKWDGGINNPKRKPVVLEACHVIESPVLRAVMAKELADLGVPDTEWQSLCDTQSYALSALDRVVVTTYVSPSQPTTRNPETASLTPQPGAESRSTNAEPPSPFCSRHPDGTDEPCPACGTARMRFDAWKANAPARARALAAVKSEAVTRAATCPDCLGTNWITDNDGNPVRRCTHPLTDAS